MTPVTLKINANEWLQDIIQQYIHLPVGSFIGGGCRNQVFDKTYHNCSTVVHEDNRGMSWQKSDYSPVSLHVMSQQSL